MEGSAVLPRGETSRRVRIENTAVAGEIDRKTDPAPLSGRGSGSGSGGSANSCEITGPAQRHKCGGLAAARQPATGRAGRGETGDPWVVGRQTGAPFFERSPMLHLVTGRRKGTGRPVLGGGGDIGELVPPNLVWF